MGFDSGLCFEHGGGGIACGGRVWAGCWQRAFGCADRPTVDIGGAAAGFDLQRGGFGSGRSSCVAADAGRSEIYHFRQGGLIKMDLTSRTYNLHKDEHFISGFCDDLEAVEQAVYLILSAERFEHVIYSWNYGSELAGLVGQPMDFALIEVKRRISEALLQDDRIEAVDGFEFDVSGGKLLVKFAVESVYGSFDVRREVRI